MQIPDWVYRDSEWHAAIYVLSAPILRSKDVMRHVDFTKHEIDFPALQKEAKPWSKGEKLLVNLANHLFNADCDFDLRDAIAVLDGCNMQIVLNAICIRRGGEFARMVMSDVRQV